MTRQLATSTHSKSFLFALWEGGGNTPPTLAVVRRLLAAGHRVRLLGDPCQEDEVKSTGATFLPWTTAPRRMDKRGESDHVRDWKVSNPIDLIGRLRDNLFFGPAERYARDVAAQLGAAPTDCIVSSDMLFGPSIAAKAAGVPCAFLAPNVYLYPLPGVPPFGPGFFPATSDEERALHAEVAASTYAAFGEGTTAFNAARAAFGLPPLSHPFDQLARITKILILSSACFDFLPSEPDSRMKHVGPELEDPTWTNPWSSPWAPDDQRPLVLVGLSSTFQDQKSLLRRIAKALSTMDLRVVLTTGPAIDPTEISVGSNTQICRSAPHSEVLKKAQLMITHCGHGSVMRGLSAGVPLLCVPMGRDQNDNAARVVHQGAGIRLGTDQDERSIRSAIERLLVEPSYRRAAIRLGTQIRHDFEHSTVVAHLEELAGRTHRCAA